MLAVPARPVMIMADPADRPTPDGEQAGAFKQMAWTDPQYTKTEVNAAGRVLVRGVRPPWSTEQWDAFERAIAIIDNWRASHSFPLNTLQMNLRNSARRLDPNALIAQRIKRLISIADKLHRFPKMKLSQIQDIGGCRAVLETVDNVRSLADYYIHMSNIKHQRTTVDDYISQPKASGYRGVHIVYRYRSDKNQKYNDLKIEMQLRSRYQHAWATAVETVGTFVRQALKSSIGEDDWLRFFALMGTAISTREDQPPVPDTPTCTADLVDELKHYSAKLDVQNRLRGYGNAIRAVRQHATRQTMYYLLELDPGQPQLVITGFNQRELSRAQEKYSEAERRVRERPGTDAVLVSVDRLTALERAYPNYFADTHVFVQLLDQTLRGEEEEIALQPLKIEAV